MKIKHLREWLNALPKEEDENDLVFRKIKGDDHSGNLLAHDKPIVGCGIDKGNNEAYFYDESSVEYFN